MKQMVGVHLRTLGALGIMFGSPRIQRRYVTRTFWIGTPLAGRPRVDQNQITQVIDRPPVEGSGTLLNDMMPVLVGGQMLIKEAGRSHPFFQHLHRAPPEGQQG